MILTSIKKISAIIKKNKIRLLLIFFLQTIFFITLSIIGYNTIIPAMEHAKDAMDYYDKINMTQDSGTFGYLGENPLVIYESYKGMISYFELMLLFCILAFIAINSPVWAFSDDLVNKKNLKQFFNYIINFIILTISFILLFYIFIFEKLKSSLVKLESDLMPLVWALILFFILIYFLLIGFSLIDKRKIKEILKLTFKLGILRFPRIIIIYLFNLIILFLFSYLIYISIESNMILLSIAVILFVFSIILTRLFLIISLNELVKKN